MSAPGDAAPWGDLLRAGVASEEPDAPEPHEREAVDPLEAFAFSTGKMMFSGGDGAARNLCCAVQSAACGWWVHCPLPLWLAPPAAHGSPCLLPPPPTAVLVMLMIVWTTLGHKASASTKFLGEGSSACMLGLAVGAALFVARKLFHPDMLQDMLSFDPSSFFV